MSKRQLFFVLAAAVGAVGLLPACTDAGRVRHEVHFDLVSTERTLHKVGANEEVLYGWNHLEAQTSIDGEAVAVELQAGVEYLNGVGPCEGLFTLTFPDDSVIAAAFTDCRAAAASGDSGARFASGIRVIGGSGRFVDVRGSGSYTGERREEIGGAVRSRLVLLLDRSPGEPNK